MEPQVEQGAAGTGVPATEQPEGASSFPYQGEWGRTRTEHVHVPVSGAVARSVPVHRVVNVETDPELREPALEGRLHELDGGQRLAVPFVYHDPASRKFALVVPEALRHRALHERAQWMERLAADSSHPIPDYVWELPVVLGCEELAAYLDRVEPESNGRTADRESELAAREAELSQRSEQLTAREQELAHLEAWREQLNQREQELSQQLEAQRREFELREQELETRLQTVREREAELARATPGQPDQPAGDSNPAAPGAPSGAAQSEAEAAPNEGAMPAPLPEEGPEGPDGAALDGADAEVEGPDLSALPDEESDKAPDLAQLGHEGADEQVPDLAQLEREGVHAKEDAADEEAEAEEAQAEGAQAEDAPSQQAQDLNADLAQLRGEETPGEHVPGQGAVEPAGDGAEAESSPQENTGVLDLSEAVEVVEGGAAEQDSAEALVDESEVEEVDDDEEMAETSAGEHASPKATRPSTTSTSEHTQEIELDEIPSEGEATTDVREVRLASDEASPAPVRPPREFVEDRYLQMAATVSGESVWLFVRGEEGHEAAFQDTASVDLLVQLSVVEHYPIVLLALVDRSGDRPYVRRLALDPQRSDHQAVVDQLTEQFTAKVVLLSPADSYQHTVDVSAPRRRNAELVRDRAQQEFKQAEPAVDSATALERALAVPPPIREPEHPFHAGELNLDDPMAVARAVGQLSDWSSPDKLDYALLALSIPRDEVDEASRQVMRVAVQHGVALESPLLERAVEYGLSSDRSELVQQLIEAFRHTAEQTDHGGLDEQTLADNWERLLRLASEHEVSVDAETHEQAQGHIRSARGQDVSEPAAGPVDPAKLPELGVPELVVLLDHPRGRQDAALELCRRGDPEILPTLFKAVRKMPRDEVARVVPRVLTFGESSGDVFIDGLEARKSFVRQASALALGELKLRRSVAPLVQMLQRESSEAWKEAARVLGDFGAPALRPLTRALKDPKGSEERLARAFAHLMEGGYAQQVEDVARNEQAVARIAEQAQTLRDVVKEHTQAVRGSDESAAQDPVVEFSRHLYAELEHIVTGG